MGLMLATTFTLTNCAKEIDAPVQEPSANIPFEIVASTVDTKTANDGLNTVWVEGDAINLFHAEATTATYVNNGSFAVTDLETGLFEGTLASDLTEGGSYDWYAMYPYSKYVEAPNGIDYSYVGNRNGVTQSGYNSKAHLSGSSCALYGAVKSVAAGERPVVTMHHLTSVIAISVNNGLEDTPLTVSTVSFTAPEDVVGSYYIDFTGDKPTYTPSEGYVSTTASVSVSDGTALAYRENATVYIPVKPFTANAGDVLKVSVNGYEKELTLEADVEFVAGNIKPMTFYFDQKPVYNLPYEETFSSSLGAFTIEGEVPDGLSYVWTYDSSYGAKASAYVSGTAYAQESYLVSPILNLEGVENAKMSFDHAGNYFGTKTEEATLWVRPVGGEWEQLTIPTYFSSWTFVNSGEINLSAYAGEKIQIGFKYVTSDTKAGTWEIKNVEVVEGTMTPIITGVENPETIAAEGADVTVVYSITNPTEGVSLTATTDATWITDIDCSVAGEVSFTVAANDGEARNAAVVFSYTGAESVTVLVSQLAVGGTAEVAHELSFADKANRTSFSTSQQVWEQNGVVLTNDKGSSTSNVADYANPARFYKSSKLTIEMSDGTPMTKIEFTCNNATYTTALQNSITAEGVTVSVSSNVVTVVFSEPQTSYVIASLTGGQVRMNSLTVYTNN